MDEVKEYVIKVNANGKLADECRTVLQAKELVRCKDCKRYYANGGNCDQVLADWFCADWELKGDG